MITGNMVLCHRCWKRCATRKGRIVNHRNQEGNRCPGSGAKV